MNDRIKQLQAALGMTQKEFAESLGFAPGALSNIYSGRTNATNNHVVAIHRAFPHVNVNWLMFGEGEMYDAPHSSPNDMSMSQDGSPASPDGSQISPNGMQLFPDGSQSSPSGVQIPRDGSQTVRDGSQTVRGGSQAPGEGMSNGQVRNDSGYFNDDLFGSSVEGAFASMTRKPQSQRNERGAQGRGQRASNVDARQSSNADYNEPYEDAKKLDIHKRKIKEIRIFFDDGTYETFVPSK